MTFIETDNSSNTETKFCAITLDKHGNFLRGKEWSIKKYPPKSKHFPTQSPKKNSSSSKEFNRIKSSNISTNSYNVVLKNHGSIPLNSKKAFQALCNYIADHNDKKNENKEKVSLIYFNPKAETQTEMIQEKEDKDDKLALEKKAFDEMKNDCITTAKNLNKRFAKSLGQKLVLSLPPEISKKITDKDFFKCAINTLHNDKNFKGHKALFALHTDQVNTNKHKHLHIFVAYGDGKNHNLHFENRKDLILAQERFKKQFAERLNEIYPDIKLEYKSKEKFYGDLRKGILFEGYDEVNKKIICRDSKGNHRSNEFCKEAYDIAKKNNLQPGDKFDYIQTKSNRPKLHPNTKKPVYYKGQIQYLNDYSFDNIQRYQDLKREFYAQAEQLQKQAREQAEELKQLIKQKQDEAFIRQNSTDQSNEIKSEIKSEIKHNTERTITPKEQKDKLQDELSDKEFELEINKTSWQFNNQFMKQFKAYKSNEISQDEYVKNLTELQAKIKKECNYDDESGFYFNDKDLKYIKKEIKKIKSNEPEIINKPTEMTKTSETPKIEQNTPKQKPKPKKDKEKGKDR